MKSKVRRLDEASLSEELRKLESEYSMSAWAWYTRFREGELGDSSEVMDWAGLCYMAMRRGLLTPPTER